MSTPSLTPYAVTETRQRKGAGFSDWSLYDIMHEGKSLYSFADAGPGRANHIVYLLNDAFTKGVETERARGIDMTAAHLAAHADVSRPPLTKVSVEMPPVKPPRAESAPSWLDAVRDFWAETGLSTDAVDLEIIVEWFDKRRSEPRARTADECPCGEVALSQPEDCTLHQPPIYPIAEREPVFPCYLYDHVDRSWDRHESANAPVSRPYRLYRDYHSYWSPDAPNPPSVKP